MAAVVPVSTPAPSGGDCAAPAPRRWSLRQIGWRRVFARQDYTAVLLMVLFGVGILLAEKITTTQRAFDVYDATISYAFNSDTVPTWAAVALPLGLQWISVFVGELAASKAWHACITSAVTSLLFFLVDGLAAFAACTFCTEVTKRAVGRLRPDFLSRCQPAGAGSDTFALSWGQPAAANAACTPGAVSQADLEDGHWSFPSGHTSMAFVLATYSAVYCLWAFAIRPKLVPSRAGTKQRSARSCGASFLRDLLSLLAFLWVLAQMGVAWAIGASRVADNRHHVSDVISGAVLGTLTALLFAPRAIARHRRVAEREGEAEGEDEDFTTAQPQQFISAGGLPL